MGTTEFILQLTQILVPVVMPVVAFYVGIRIARNK